MTAHFAYPNNNILCGTCGWMMAIPKLGPGEYEPGKRWAWRVMCTNQVCPHLGIIYEVVPEESQLLTLRKVEP